MTATRHELTHLPGDLFYDCTACGEPWPCEPAKTELFQEMRIIGKTDVILYLGAHLAAVLVRAIAGHDWVKIDGAFERFVGWARRGPNAA